MNKLALSAVALLFFFLAIPLRSFGDEHVGIVNYAPSKFIEKADSPFFYSIGKQLKYGPSIDEATPTLFKGKFFDGEFTAVFPSPDNNKVALVSDKKLYIIQLGKPPRLALDHVEGNPPGLMSAFWVPHYLWPTVQWDSRSRYVYIARAGLVKKSLVRLDAENPAEIVEIVSDFRSLHYFLVGAGSVCFDYALENGDVVWKCSTDKGAFRAKSLNRTGIILENNSVLIGDRFMSYTPNIYETDIWLAINGFVVRGINDNLDGLFARKKPEQPLLAIVTGTNIKGHRVDGILQYGGAVLPGGRYVLLNVWHHRFKGQLLLDSDTGEYRELPKDTRVYRNLNSNEFPDFNFSVEWNKGNNFQSMILPELN